MIFTFPLFFLKSCNTTFLVERGIQSQKDNVYIENMGEFPTELVCTCLNLYIVGVIHFCGKMLDIEGGCIIICMVCR